MSLIRELEYILNLPRGVSQATKDKASIELIVNYVKTTKEYHQKNIDNGYTQYSPLLEEVIKGGTTFEKELKKFLKKYGYGKLIKSGKHEFRLMDGSGYTKFAFEQGIFSIFQNASEYLDTSTKLLDGEIERLRPELMRKLYRGPDID